MFVKGYEIKPSANLHGANLHGADLYNADLRNANLYGADMRNANLYNANLYGADMRGADMRGADMRNANLYNANLYGAKNIPKYVYTQTTIVPEVGAFEGFKKANGKIVHLRIPEDAKRSNSTGRKCRASYVFVLSIDGKPGQVLSDRGNLVYTSGDYAWADKWDEDRWNECSHGIHFFLTRKEAENW